MLFYPIGFYAYGFEFPPVLGMTAIGNRIYIAAHERVCLRMQAVPPSCGWDRQRPS